MIKCLLRVTALALFCLSGAGCAALAQQPASPQNTAPPAYAMSLGDMMNTLVQPRHAKLGLAGHAQNWPLAGYAIAEIRQVFSSIVKAQPRFRGMPVGELVDAALGQAMTAVDTAVQEQDPKKFNAAYDQLTQGCNACHVELDHPYVVIKTPDVSAFPNQEFGAGR